MNLKLYMVKTAKMSHHTSLENLMPSNQMSFAFVNVQKEF